MSNSNYGRNDPLHGVTLKAVLVLLVGRYGWETLGEKIAINCFTNEPSINSSLKFLRKTPWARQQVEALYVQTVSQPDAAYANWQAPGAGGETPPG